MLLRDRFGAGPTPCREQPFERDGRVDVHSDVWRDRVAVGAARRGDGTLLAIENVVMLPSMLAAMLLRRDEYSPAAHGHRQAEHAIASRSSESRDVRAVRV